VNVLLPTPPFPDNTSILYFTEDSRCFNTSKAKRVKYALKKMYNIKYIFTCLGQEVELHQMHKYFDLDILDMQIPDQQMNYPCLDNLKIL